MNVVSLLVDLGFGFGGGGVLAVDGAIELLPEGYAFDLLERGLPLPRLSRSSLIYVDYICK